MEGIQLQLVEENLIAPDSTAEVGHCRAPEKEESEAESQPSEPQEEEKEDVQEDTRPWMTAADTAMRLSVTVRRLRGLATAGKVERSKQDGRTMYRPLPEKPTDSRTESTNAVTLSSDTRPGRRVKETTDHPAKARVRALQTKVGDGTVILDERDVTFFSGETASEDLLETNRELMRLVDNVLDRWSLTNNARSDAEGKNHAALKQALELQQVLGHWQSYAGQLERELIHNRFVAARALDVAEEALGVRWHQRKRRQTLSTRVDTLKTQVALG